jgi:hypothetical protein
MIMWIARFGGGLVLLLGLGITAYNERHLAQYHNAMARQGGAVLDLGDQATPAAGQYGSTTRVSGVPKVVEAARDPEFDLRVDTPVLIRHVEMFQWREVRLGDNVHYELDWVDRPLDSGDFKVPSGHANPGAFPIAGRQFDAGQVRLGRFLLSTPLLHALPGSQTVPPDIQHLPPNLAVSFQLAGDALVTSARPDSPRLGDLRVSWESVPLQAVTIVARIDGERLVPSTTPTDGKGFDVQVGDRTLLEVLPGMPEPPRFPLLLRILSLLLAATGVLLLSFHLRLGRDPVFGIGTGAILIGAVAGVLWLGTDTKTVAIWLLISVLGIALAIWRARRHLSTKHLSKKHPSRK